MPALVGLSSTDLEVFVMMDNTWVASALLATMAVVNVSLWTLRVTFAARGLRVPAATTAAAEALLFTIAFSHVSTHLGSPTRVGAYAIGVAVGTYVGIAVDHRLSARQARDAGVLEVPDPQTAIAARTTSRASSPPSPLPVMCPDSNT